MKLLLVATSLISLVWGNVIVESTQEEVYLQNIQQVTSSVMGFDKAGEAYFSPDGESIIFQAVPVGKKDYQIYTMNLNTRSPVMVSTGKGRCTCGFYRPDGKKIIFASSHESPLIDEEAPYKTSNNYVWDLTPYMQIYEAELDGSNLKCLTSGPAYHAECGYSPDGKHIVYASNESGSMNIYIINADGSNVRRLTHTDHSYNGGSFFSPDGKWILFRADREQKDILQLFLISVDGKEERQLTNNGHVNWAPFWHPNNKIIAYTTSKHGHRAYQIYLLDVETGEEHRLTHSSTFEGLPSFSKDGGKIAWTSKRGNSTPQIFIADFTLPEKN
ncbi:MAG: DPP IV N-terminal domain-containing protein [Rhabdochlamydiaceae bacterium]|jgi:Tol biopolymer transport system component